VAGRVHGRGVHRQDDGRLAAPTPWIVVAWVAGAVVPALARRFGDLGGTLRLNSAVGEILIDERGGASGATFVAVLPSSLWRFTPCSRRCS